MSTVYAYRPYLCSCLYMSMASSALPWPSSRASAAGHCRASMASCARTLGADQPPFWSADFLSCAQHGLRRYEYTAASSTDMKVAYGVCVPAPSLPVGVPRRNARRREAYIWYTPQQHAVLQHVSDRCPQAPAQDGAWLPRCTAHTRHTHQAHTPGTHTRCGIRCNRATTKRGPTLRRKFVLETSPRAA